MSKAINCSERQFPQQSVVFIHHITASRRVLVSLEPVATRATRRRWSSNLTVTRDVTVPNRAARFAIRWLFAVPWWRRQQQQCRTFDRCAHKPKLPFCNLRRLLCRKARQGPENTKRRERVFQSQIKQQLIHNCRHRAVISLYRCAVDESVDAPVRVLYWNNRGVTKSHTIHRAFHARQSSSTARLWARNCARDDKVRIES